MVSALTFRLRSPGLGPGNLCGQCSGPKHFYFHSLTVCLSTQVYKWVSPNLVLEVDLTIDQHPIQWGVGGGEGGEGRGSRITPCQFMLVKLGD